MSGSSILRDGHSVIEEYGADLDQLNEGIVSCTVACII